MCRVSLLVRAALFVFLAVHVLSSGIRLKFVHVVWRHGDRSPSDPTFPTDTQNPEWSWPQGWGELTRLGIRQQRTLGAYLRRRYVDSGFLPADYNSSQIYVRSSDFNRTIMSAMANLDGMFPSEEGPMPVHSVPGTSDPLLWMDRPCPEASRIYFNEVLRSDEARRVERENADLIALLRRRTGHPLATLDDVRFIFDPLNCERIHNDTHRWPDWVTPSLFRRIKELQRVSKTFAYHDPRLQRFRGSLLWWDIAQRSLWKANDDPRSPSRLKYYAFSAHDSTMQALLENLGAYDGRVPPYASALMFELHENRSGHFVQTWYLNETDGEKAVPVAVRGCESAEECTLETFVRLARRNAPADWYVECGIQRERNAQLDRVAVAAKILTTLTASLFVLLIVSVAQLVRVRWR